MAGTRAQVLRLGYLEAAVFRFPHIVGRARLPCLRHSSVTTAPASASFRMPMICSSENRFRFMRPSLSLGRTLAPSGENAGVTSSSTTGVRRLAARSAEGALEQGSPLITELVGTFGYCFIPWRLAASPRAFICARTSTSKLAFKPEEENGGMSKIPGLPHRAQTAISSLWRRPCRSIPKNGFFRPSPRAAGPIACHGARERHRHRSRCCEYSAHRLR